MLNQCQSYVVHTQELQYGEACTANFIYQSLLHLASFPGLPVSFGGHTNFLHVAAEKAGQPGDKAVLQLHQGKTTPHGYWK